MAGRCALKIVQILDQERHAGKWALGRAGLGLIYRLIIQGGDDEIQLWLGRFGAANRVSHGLKRADLLAPD